MSSPIIAFVIVTVGLVLIGVMSAVVSAGSYMGKVWAIRILFPKITRRKD